MKTHIITATAAIFLLTVATSCYWPGSGYAHRSQSPLYTRRWKVIEINGAPIDFKSGYRDIPHIRLTSDGRAGGNSGCNDYGCEFAVKGDSIWFYQIWATKVYCESIKEVEQPLFETLRVVDQYKLIGTDSLFLLRRGDAVIKFVWG